jgi:hypothetical protein
MTPGGMLYTFFSGKSSLGKKKASLVLHFF